MIDKSTSQKEIFLESEADEWFKRNAEVTLSRDFSQDLVVQAIAQIRKMNTDSEPLAIMEVGAGAGGRLEWLGQVEGVGSVQGIEPSLLAVESANARGLSILQGTADRLPYEDESFDVVIFGFCLYLCDRRDLFQIANETNRVLKPNGWIIIQDFYSPIPMAKPYHHKPGVSSFKMDYRKLFDWNPMYVCYSHDVHAHGGGAYTDDAQEWVAISVLRKRTWPNA